MSMDLEAKQYVFILLLSIYLYQPQHSHIHLIIKGGSCISRLYSILAIYILYDIIHTRCRLDLEYRSLTTIWEEME